MPFHLKKMNSIKQSPANFSLPHFNHPKHPSSCMPLDFSWQTVPLIKTSASFVLCLSSVLEILFFWGRGKAQCRGVQSLIFLLVYAHNNSEFFLHHHLMSPHPSHCGLCSLLCVSGTCWAAPCVVFSFHCCVDCTHHCRLRR